MATTVMVVIVGPTACGKTDLALQVAKKYNGEIVCADSRTIYRGMDIGTAKPTQAERAMAPHHLLDVCEPGEYLSAAGFKQLAEVAIADITARGRLPIVVGGSGLYIDGLVYDFQFGAQADEGRRREFEKLSLDELQERLRVEDVEAYDRVDLANRRRVIRALEMVGQEPVGRRALEPDVWLLGCMLNKEIVQDRVEKRIEKMLEEGFIQEVEALGLKYGWDNAAFEVIGYRAFKDVALGTKSVADGVADFVRGDMALYKKQVTWFKRNLDIVWLDQPFAVQADAIVARLVAV